MAKAHIDFSGTELSGPVVKTLESKLSGRVVEFDTKNSDLDLDGKFVESVPWQGQLWDTISKASDIKSVGKPRKVTSNLEEPGTYNVELELWDRVLKFKLKINMPSGSDKTSRSIKRNSNPPHVNVRTKGAKLADCPKDYVGDLKELMKLMGKTASYSYVGGGGSSKGWKPSFKGHQSHEQPGKGWKAYIDEPTMGTGTTWRLYFELDFDVTTQTLHVALTKVSEDH